jgi:O-acetyl-ADP-ribose deacetylase (regulator of RNase III)
MVRVLTGNLFDSEAQTLVNAVNCVGVMDKGIALAFKRRYPAMFADYVARCKDGRMRLGEPYLYRDSASPYILNFPTKNHWRSATKLDDIVVGLAYLEAHYRAWGITSLAVPALGCGAGQLAWDAVGPVLQVALGRLDIPVELYAPVENL